MTLFLKKYAYLLSVSAALGLLISCANMSSPTGGSYDLDPPKVVKSSPKFNETNVNTKKIVLEFDENVVVEKPSEMVIITPPQRTMPQIYSVNRKVFVELKDTLLENTTYTIDFTDAIADNNEKNVLENFSISFSTGDHVDSLAISGIILEAENLEPVKGMYVGLHSNLHDSAFVWEKFERISRTNDRGRFTIRGVAPGEYRLYGLNDANRDYRYDNPSEAIAFMFETVVPTVEKAFRTDTVFDLKQAGLIDTVKNVEYTRFLPDDIVLRAFTSKFKRQYLQKHEREPNKLHLFFGAPTDMPVLEPMNFEATQDWAILEKSRNNDTLTYWIKDKNIAAIDTITFRIEYMRTDSLNQLYSYTDTLNFIDRTRKKSEKELEKEEKERQKRLEKGEEEPTIFLNVKHNLSGTFDIFNTIMFEFEQPLADSLASKITFQSVVDSTFTDLPVHLEADSLNPRKYTMKHRWEYGKEYRVAIDSATVHSIYGLFNDKIDQKFKVKEKDQYGAWAFELSGLNDSIPTFVELLDKSDKPIRKVKVKDNIALFRNLNPGQYFARITFDENNNGVWDTGDFYKELQPEMVCYHSDMIDIKANFELTKKWHVDPSTLPKQKPLEVTKNKPQERDSKRKQLEREEQKKQGEQNNRNTRDPNDPYNNSSDYGSRRNNQTNTQYNTDYSY